MIILCSVLFTLCSLQTINVTINDSGSPNECTALEHPICPNLTYALKEWFEKASTLLTSFSNIRFLVYSEHQIFKAKEFTFKIPASTQYNIVGISGKITIYCQEDVYPTFYGMNVSTSGLSIDSITFVGCGRSLMYGLSSVKLTKVTFSGNEGVQLRNIDNTQIHECNFLNNYLTPNASLQITYQDYIHSGNPHVVSVQDCKFKNNNEKYGFSALVGISGVIALSITNSSLLNFHFTLCSCEFNQNVMRSHGCHAPMFYISQVEASNISILVENSTFHYNTYSIMTTMTAIKSETVLVSFYNNTFFGNSNLNGDCALIDLQYINPHLTHGKSVNFFYSQNIFSNNFAIPLYISSIGYSNHVIKNSNFTENNGIKHVILIFGTRNTDSRAYVTLENISITGNKMLQNSLCLNTSVILVQLVNLRARGLYLTGNKKSVATLLTLFSVNATFEGKNVFSDNRGRHGGALAIGEVDGTSNYISTTVDTVISFNNNYADYGGAVYIDSLSFIQSLDNNTGPCLGKVEYFGNHARVAGHSIFYNTVYRAKMYKVRSCEQFFNVSEKRQVSTAPLALSFKEDKISLFVGQTIKLVGVTLTDNLNQSSSCNAQFNLMCNKSEELCELTDSNIELIGPPDVFLTGVDSNISTQLHIASTKCLSSPEGTNSTVCMSPALQIQCEDPLLDDPSKGPSTIYISLQHGCPIGFEPNDISKTCQCSYIPSVNFQCSLDLGVACIKKGYWVAQDGTKALMCGFPPCRLSNGIHSLCSATYNQDLISLPFHEDDQCASNRGGIRCSRCRSGYHFTFEGVHCTSNCKKEYPYLLTLFAICFQFLIVAFILAAIRLKVEIGSGFLYGPLLFLAIVSQLPYGYYSQYTVLKVIVSTFTSIFLLNLEIFGEVPWCFGQRLDPLFLESFYYLGPMLVWLMIIVFVRISRCNSCLLSKIQKSPIQAICLLIILSFWSVTKTSIRYLMPLKYGDDYHANIDPTVKYFRSWHIFFVLIAIILIVVVITPFISILALSNVPKISYRLRLHRFKPLLDEFQSCYHDNYRWYCITYYIAWILYLVLRVFPLGAQMILMLILSLHFVFQPYKKQVLNVVDMLLFLDLIALSFLLDQEENMKEDNTFKTILIYTMTLIPLVYIALGCIGIFIVHCYSRNKGSCLKLNCFQNLFKRQIKTMLVQVENDNDYLNEREPLIHALQDEYKGRDP